MANMFENDSRQFKFDVLVELCRQANEGNVEEDKIQGWAKQLVSKDGPRFRCCIYKEREVLRQRVRLAMGKMASDTAEYNPRQIVQVIDAACDGCTIQKIRVTDNCRKCMAKSCLSACHFGAIHIGTNRSEIDYTKCKECGACARACPYNAIVVTERPCYAHCPVQAISWDENKIAQIDEAKCINCGQCENACPFGAIEDISWVVPVATLLRMKSPAYAIVAPSIQGQFENASLSQIKKSIEMLGFEKVQKLMERNVIEIAPLAYMRGRTLNDSFIILDESQNTTVEQMKMFLTRIGFNSKAVITGDVTQIDLPRSQKSGLRHAMEVLGNVPELSFNYFDSQDIVRHPVVAKVVQAYERWEAEDEIRRQHLAEQRRKVRSENQAEIERDNKDE